MSKVYKAKCIVSRGRESEIKPGTLFVPTESQRKDLLALNAIEEASPQEAALFEKLDAPAKKGKPLDHDGDGKNGGSLKGAQSTRARGAAKKAAAKDDDAADDAADDETDSGDGDIVG